jgi:CheY-like chemotaxis protein
LSEGGKFVKISIKDSGVGIPVQHQARIFEPYYTTKQRGSGLGLATSYSIIKGHGGMIDVSSQANVGSTFIVYLPAKEGKADQEQQVSLLTAGRKGRVLVMDDEDVVRAVAKDMIEALGHDVECAISGEDAIEKFRASAKAGNPFDVVILDLTVRGAMGGEQTLRKLRELDPDVKAVVSSGYTESSALSDFKSHGFTAVLTKPYTYKVLTDTLSALLG